MSEERRAQPRFDICLGAEISANGRSFTASTKDVSTGGCCLESAHGLVDGTSVSLALFLVVDGIEESDYPPLQVHATVQWTAESDDDTTTWRHLCGLKFSDITDDQRAWLDGIIRQSAG